MVTSTDDAGGPPTAAGRRVDLTLQQYEKFMPTVAIKHGGRRIVYVTPNTACLQRAQTLFTKEPDTIAWLDGMPAGAVLVDIGANVGMYSLYAAVMREARVYAFEPEAQNYATLCRNIVANAASERVVAWCAALSDRTGFDRLHLSAFQAGSSCHSFGAALDPYLRPAAAPFVQGCFATTLDQLVADSVLPVPQYIKIDVDGLEHSVIAGAAQTLRDPAVQSLLVEINPQLAEHRGIIATLTDLGFRHDPEQVARAERREGYFKGVAEYVFRR